MSDENEQRKSNRPPGGASAVADEILAENATNRVAQLGKELLDDKPTTSTQAARVLSDLIVKKADLMVPLVDRFCVAIESENRRVVQTAAEALPEIAKLAPARVAKQLDKLREAFAKTPDIGKHGLVQTFANLCIASVAYQKRLEPILSEALGGAEPKTLVDWTKIVLPALKGEPHANARAVVEKRLYEIPKPQAQEIADFLGIKLRVRTN
ncbi:MAG: hypothetical protein KC417_14985 [Myxococcales bacterium]|nr:hypothetical protein [Myxococcales bacterium]